MEQLRTITLTAHGVRCAFPSDAWPQVRQGNAWRLSAMQRGLLSETPWVRVVNAPTGSGKSYAFQKAVLPQGTNTWADQVLFIAPTRRLTEALSRSLKEGLAREVRAGAPDAGEDAIHTHVKEAVLVWNGAQEAVAGMTKTALRLTEIGHMAERKALPVLGKTVFTVLEVVRDILFPTRLLKGRTEEVARHFLARFRHIVFDEFHTLGEDGVALALVVVALVRQMNREAEQQQQKDGVPRQMVLVTFLSATPVDLAAFLAQGLGEPLPQRPSTSTGEGLCVLEEELVHADEPAWATGEAVRPIHGDVSLHLVATERDEGLDALARAHIDDIVEEIRHRRQVVFIFDSKGDAMRRMHAIDELIRDACQRARTPAPAIGVVNASDDRARRADGQGVVVLDDADVLLATASVEAGVTFRDNRLLFMEPGPTVLNFVQRLGRCARGAESGHVWVRTNEKSGSDYRAWWATLADELARKDGEFPERMHVDVFLSRVRAVTTENATESFIMKDEKTQPHRMEPRLDNGFYSTDSLGKRAWFKAAFFWAAVWVRLKQFHKHMDEPYIGLPPKLVIMAFRLLEKVDRLRGRNERKRLNRAGAGVGSSTIRFQAQAFHPWLAGWREGLLALRDIGPPVWVIDHENGKVRARPFERGWLWRWTDAFQEGEPVGSSDAEKMGLEGFRDDDVLLRIRGTRAMTLLTVEAQRARYRSNQGTYCPTFQSPCQVAGICAEKPMALRAVAKELTALSQALAAPALGAGNEAKVLANLARWVPLVGVARRQEDSLDEDAAQWRDQVLLAEILQTPRDRQRGGR